MFGRQINDVIWLKHQVKAGVIRMTQKKFKSIDAFKKKTCVQKEVR